MRLPYGDRTRIVVVYLSGAHAYQHVVKGAHRWRKL